MTTQECYEAGLTRNLFTSKEDALAKRENIAKWVTELECGRYSQSAQRLRDEDGYCCLGVACVSFGMNSQRDEFGDWLFEDEETELPLQVRLGMAFLSNEGLWDGDDFTAMRSLVALNDDLGWNFKQIAAFIRGSFKGCTGEDL